MARIDTTRIEGYESMSDEDKVKALEAVEYEDNAVELERLKKANDKLSSESADWKRKHNALLSEDEQKKQQDADKFADMQKELDGLRKDKTISDHKVQLLALGYEEALADETAQAMFEGDAAKVFMNQKKHLETQEKALRAEILKGTPTPPAGKGGDDIMTLEKLQKMSPQERYDFSIKNPEDYQKLYGGTE